MTTRRESVSFLLVSGLFFLAQYMYAPFLTPYVGVLGGTLAMTGLVAGSYGLLQFLLRIPLGLWSDRLARRKPFVVAGVVLAAISALGMGWAPAPGHLLVFRSLSGVGAATWVAFTVFYTGLFPPEETGKRISLLTFAGSSGQLAGNLIGGFLAEKWGWTAPFYGAVWPGLLGVVLALGIRESKGHRPAQPTETPTGSVVKVVARRAILEPSLLALLSHFIFYATILGFTPVYVTNLGISKLTLGVFGTVSGAAYVLGTLLAAAAEAKGVPWRRCLTVSFALMAIATWATPYSRGVLPLAVGFTVLGLCRGTTYPVMMAVILKESPARYHASAMGFFQAVYAIGMFAGPAVAGLVAQRLGLAAVFPFCSLLALAALVWCVSTPGHRHDHRRQESLPA